VPYFFLAGAFLFWLVIATIAIASVRAIPALRSMFPLVWRVAVWATVGLIAANILLGLVIAAGFLVLPSESDPSAGREALQVGLAFTALLGPFAASAVGWLGGAIFGVLLYLRLNREAPPNTSLERTRER